MTERTSKSSKSIRISLKQFQQKQQQSKKQQQAHERQYQQSQQILDHLQYKYNVSQIMKLSQDFFIKTNQVIQSFKSIYLFQKIIQEMILSICNQFERQKFNQLKIIITVFMEDVKSCLNQAKQMKQKDLQGNYTMKQSFNNKVQNYLCLLYGLEIKEKKSEVQRRINYQNYVSKYLKLHINKLQYLIDQNSRLIPSKTVKDKLNPLYDKIDHINNQMLTHHQTNLDQRLKIMLKQCQRIKKQNYLKAEIDRINYIQKKSKRDKQIGQKYKNMAGVLITPFNYYQKVK